MSTGQGKYSKGAVAKQNQGPKLDLLSYNMSAIYLSRGQRSRYADKRLGLEAR